MDHPTNPPVFPELPLGLGAAFLVMAGLSAMSPSEDRLFLVIFFAVVGAVAVGVAAAMARAAPGDGH
jgi:hypothetical protein